MTNSGRLGTRAADPADEAATISGFGPIPAPVARAWVRSADRAWIRRLCEDPVALQPESNRDPSGIEPPSAGYARNRMSLRVLTVSPDTCGYGGCRRLGHLVRDLPRPKVVAGRDDFQT